MKDSKISRKVILSAIPVAAAIVLLAAYVIGPTMSSRDTQGSFEPVSNFRMTTGNNSATSAGNPQGTVAVGGGNLSMSLNQFSPSSVEIHTGDSVTFYAPRGSTELHNVIFDLSNGTAISSIELAFAFPPGFSPQNLQLLPPDNFGEPIVQNMSDGRQSIVALNKVLFYPSAVTQNGNISYVQEQQLLQQMEQGLQQGSSIPPPLSANYTMQGNEVIVSSGLILDVNGFTALEQGQGAPGQEAPNEEQQQQRQTSQQGIEEYPPPAYPILSNFTMTFNEPGAYPFFCAFHPGMIGIVNVQDGAATQNSTRT